MIVHELVKDGNEDSLRYSYFCIYLGFFLEYKSFLNQNDYTINNKNIIPTEQSISVLKNHIMYWNTWSDCAMEKFWRNLEATLG